MYLKPDKHNGYGYLEAIYNTITRYSRFNIDKESVVYRISYTTIEAERQMAKTLFLYRQGVNDLNKMMDFKAKGCLIFDC